MKRPARKRKIAPIVRIFLLNFRKKDQDSFLPSCKNSPSNESAALRGSILKLKPSCRQRYQSNVR
jgi:hypothetical protein